MTSGIAIDSSDDQPSTLVKDESLLREASLRSTGATIHRVRCMVHTYTLAQRAGMQPEFEAAERRLRLFVATGLLQD